MVINYDSGSLSTGLQKQLCYTLTLIFSKAFNQKTKLVIHKQPHTHWCRKGVKVTMFVTPTTTQNYEDSKAEETLSGHVSKTRIYILR